MSQGKIEILQYKKRGNNSWFRIIISFYEDGWKVEIT